MAQVAVAIAISAAMSYAAAALTPHPKPTAQELAITSSAYGDAVPLVYGGTRVACHLIWSDGVKHAKTSKKGGKGHGGKKSAQPVTYTANLAFAVCEGPIDQVLTIWANGAVIFDARGVHRDATSGNLVGMGKNIVRFHYGTEDQLPDPLIQTHTEALNGVGSTPAYRGMAYIVFESMNLTPFGNTVPNLHAEVTRTAIPAIPMTTMVNLGSESFHNQTDFYSRSAVVFDYTANTMYSISNHGISVWDLGSDTEIRQIEWEDAGFKDPVSDITFVNWALTPGDGGKLVALVNGSNTKFATFDLNSLSFKGYSLTYSYFDDIAYLSPFWIWGVPLASSSSNIRGHYFMVSNNVAPPFIWDGDHDGIAYHFPADLIATTDDIRWVAQPVVFPADGHTDIYFPFGQVTDVITIYRIRVGLSGLLGGTTLFNLAMATADGTVAGSINISDLLGFTSGAQWTLGDVQPDLVDGGIIINVQHSGGGSGPSANNKAVLKWLKGVGVMWVHPGLYQDRPQNGWVTNMAGGTGSSILVSGRYGTVTSDGAAWIIDTATGETVFNKADYPHLVIPTGPSGIHHATAWDGLNNSMIMWDSGIGTGGGFYRLYIGRYSNGGTTVGAIVQDICIRAGLGADDIDVTALTQSVEGYVIGRRVDGKAVLEQLSELYFFDCVESDNILKFVPRGTTPTLTITQADLGETRDKHGKGSSDNNYWKHVKKQEIDLPYQVDVRTLDPVRNFQYSTQQARRTRGPVPTMSANSIRTVEAPLVMDSTAAAKIAQQILFTEWLERDTYETTLGWKWAYLDPTDVVSVHLDNGDSYVARMDKTTVGANLVMSIQLQAEDNQTYSAPAFTVGASGDNLIAPASAINITLTNMLLLDIPLIRDSDYLGSSTNPLYYGGVVYSGGGWSGAQVYRSIDGGSSYSAHGGISSLPWAGTIAGTLPFTMTPFVFDATASIKVYEFRGSSATLTTSTMTGLDNGENMMLVGNEIISFLTATLNTDGSYTLTGLYRGLRGTDWACTLHTPGEVCVLLNENALSLDTYASGAVNNVWDYKAVTYGGFTDIAPISAITLSGAPLKPYPVTHITRAVSGSDLVVSWTRRSRLGGGMIDGTGTVPLYEDSEAYEAYILSAPYAPATFDPTNPTTYVRAFTGLTAPTLTYTSVQMATDSFSPTGSTLYIVVFQRSAEVGRGFPSFSSVPPY